MDRRTDSRTWAICRVTEWDFALSGAAAVRGVAVSALAGIVFGLQPARRAARV
jgi:ABC-type antimicrobial peptide transport system permease subunit